jgi:4-amino-4-deoxy-L-arabinose transferase-like glycosyltransferase
MTATALMLRLAGIFRESLPSSGRLAVALAALHLLSLSTRPWQFGRWRDIFHEHAFGIGLFAACVIALAVRLPGFANDLGSTPLDIDEHRVAANVRHYFVTGEVLHEHIEQYPGAVFWLFAASSLVAFLRALANGLVSARNQLPVDAFAEAARLANIWVAVATVAITGLMGLRLSGPTAGLLGAALVAIVPISVETTVLVRNDAGMVLVVVAAVYAAMVYYDERSLAWIAAAGAFAGLAAAIKYTAVFALAPALFAAFSGAPVRNRIRAALVAVLAFGLAVATSNHFIWADFPNFLRQVSSQYSFTGSTGHPSSSDNPAIFYPITLAWAGPGWPMVLLAAAFAIYALSTRQLKFWIFVSFPLAYIWFMAQRPLQVPRWVYPVVPFVAVGGGAALVAGIPQLVATVASRAPWPRLGRLVAAVAVVGILWQPMWAGAVSFSRRLTPQTHELTEAWIREHATPGTVVLLGQGWLDLSRAQIVARRVPNLRATLDKGIEELGGCDWVVVPEPVFGHPLLRQLGFLQRFESDQSFGGNLGIDYEVYAVPHLTSGTICGSGRAP